MKYLFVFLLVGLMFSCGDASGDASGDVTKEKQAKSTVKIGNLEIMTEDLGQMDWREATKACADLGDGWRLPTRDELNILFENKDKIGGFANSYYWSSTVYGYDSAWAQDFVNGQQDDYNKNAPNFVRSVRAF